LTLQRHLTAFKLLLKLLAYGICGTLLSWISSFLSNRRSRTRIGNCLSSAMPILSGVVQGSCLGPLLFIVFINDISDLFSGDTCVKFFADDVNLYSKVCTNPDSLQEGLNSIVEWSHTWQLPISENKCCIFNLNQSSDVVFSIHNGLLPVVREVVDLGVTLDHSLSLSQHIAKLSVKGHRVANLISKFFLSRDVNSLVKAFITYVRPRLEYCSVAWNPSLKKDIESSEKVQWRFTKRLPGLQRLTYCQRLNKLQLESLELRRLRLNLIFACKLVFGLIDLNLSDFLKLRTDYRHRGHKYKLFLPGCRSNTRHNFFTYRAGRIWNNLPADNTDFSNLNSFK